MKNFLDKEKRLVEVEKRILEIKDILGNEGRRKAMAIGVAMPIFEKRLAQENRPLLEELDRLETERKFIIDERNGIFWKIIWSGVVPIIVSIITSWIFLSLN